MVSANGTQLLGSVDMPWKIERKHEHVVAVTMNTNKVNAQNPAFFADLHAAFDRLETEFEDCAVVLTGTGKVFSAGLDLDHHFAMFARRDLKEIDDWFAAYRITNLRLFSYPRPTVAAINGHAYAGGFITAIVCDYRVAAEGELQFSLNEVPIGIAGGLLRDHQICYRHAGSVRVHAVRTGLRSGIRKPDGRRAEDRGTGAALGCCCCLGRSRNT
jgi:enoyl-CoA hydratase/carnithine racemase